MKSTFPQSLPSRLAMDGWWLTAAPAGLAAPGPARPRARPAALWPAMATVLLVTWLTADPDPVLGLVLACLALITCLILTQPAPARARHTAAALAILVVLPLLEHRGPLALAFLHVGTAAAIIALKSGAPTLRNLTRLVIRAPFSFLRTAHDICGGLTGRVALARTFLTALVPLSFGLIFVSLFALANPLLEQALGHAFSSGILTVLSPAHLSTIALAALILGAAAAFTPEQPKARAATGRPAPDWLRPRPVALTLIAFNLLFAVQTGLDAAYLWGGVALPDHLTYAQYAHRGAYPLVATSLLAGVFIFAASAFDPPSRLNRRLLGLWIVQNLALLISAALRLNLYVDTYALTSLRLAAFIWMALTAGCLGLMLWRIHRAHSNRWLLRALGRATCVTLYGATFLNTPHIIASYNVTHSRELTGTGQPLDHAYLCLLGWHAKPAADRFNAANPAHPIACFSASGWRYTDAPQITDWRAWGFRDARLARYLAATQPPEATRADHPDR